MPDTSGRRTEILLQRSCLTTTDGKSIKIDFSSKIQRALRCFYFFDPTGISDEKGITNYSYIGSVFEREIVKQATELIFVIDDTKFGKNVLHQLANLQETDVIITNKEIDPIHLKMMKKHEIRYVLAK